MGARSSYAKLISFSLAQQYGKVLLHGEFDWTQLNGGTNLSVWLDRVERSKGVGSVLTSRDLTDLAATSCGACVGLGRS